MNNIIFNTVGLLGDFLILLGFFLLQLEKIKSDHIGYLLMNLFGAILILFSLFFYWNLPSVIIESTWSLISIFGIYKYFTKVKR